MHFSGLRELSGKSYKAFRNRVRRHLDGVQCLTYHEAGNWWHYEWCVDASVQQFHPVDSDVPNAVIESRVVLGRYASGASQVLSIRPAENLARLRNPDYSGYYVQQLYTQGDACPEATADATGDHVHRSVTIVYKCCVYRANETYIEHVDEPSVCAYALTVCSPVACGLMQRDQYVLGASTHVSDDERRVLAETVKDMFYHAYHGYLTHAFPLDALLPLSCRGETFELGKIAMLTLIDTLDTLAILQDAAEFQHAVKLVLERADFDLDTEVSVFETTIRVLGGLLSAHLFAMDESLGLYPPGAYKSELLTLAIDLGDRLMPAFATPTGIPYGTVNLRTGVPPGETTIASTAGAGSLTMEFTMLSVLTQDPKYARAARGAARALFQRRSSLGLLGKHIDTRTGEWTEVVSGPGSNSDSFYEYLLKMYMTFNDEESLEMFATVYPAVLEHNLHGDWYADVSMWSGCGHGGVVFENLAAFWPGMQASVGHLHAASRSVNSFYRVWRDFGFVPEQFNVLDWKPLRGRGSRYPLRPELIESTFYLHEATQDSSWLRAGAHFVHSLQKHAKTTCGYATIADTETKAQEDNMPSFFLSETCKYLYLLFNTTHFYRRGQYVMTTEAHPFPILPAKLVDPIIFADSPEANATASDSESDSVVPSVGQSSYIMSQLQCAPVRFWDPFHYRLGYESAAVAKKPRCQPAAAPVRAAPAPQSGRLLTAAASKPRDHGFGAIESWLKTRLGKTLEDFEIDPDGTVRSTTTGAVSDDDGTSGHDTQAPTKAFKTLYGGAKFGHFRVDQLEHTMRFTRDDTGEWLEASGVGDAAHFLVSAGIDDQRLEAVGDQDDADASLEFTTHLVYPMKYDLTLPLERSCRLHVLVSPEREPAAPALRYSFPCVGAGFGITDKIVHTQRLHATELVLATPLDACGWLANDDVAGKIVVATRGVCFFESKARNAARRGAVGVIIVNTEPDDRVMVMGGSGGNSDDDDEDDGDGSDPVATGSKSRTTEALEIPVVMVPQRLGAWFDRQLSVAEANSERLTVEIELRVRDTSAIAKTPGARTSSRDFPFIEGSADDVRVFGREWGVHLQRTRPSAGAQHHDAYTVAIIETPSAGAEAETTEAVIDATP